MKTFTLVAATLVAGMSFALAQSATHEPAGTHGTVGAHAGVFSSEHGSMIRQHATSQRYQSHQEPGFHAQVGVALPGSAQLHPLPDGLVTQMPSARNHQYSIVNDRYVIVDPATRRVTHAFE
ncbi:MAG: DUF1236 domain-containing protein [Afipia sp.]|jgi:hypothetical protein|nr:DUF1236 domain-containing protein [Afipia sp.]